MILFLVRGGCEVGCGRGLTVVPNGRADVLVVVGPRNGYAALSVRRRRPGQPLEYKGSAPEYVMHVSPTFLFDSWSTIFHMDRRQTGAALWEGLQEYQMRLSFSPHLK